MAFSLAFTAFGAVLANETDEVDELQAEVQELRDMIAALLGDDATEGEEGDEGDYDEVVGVVGVPANFTFTENLSQGSRGEAVKYLQMVLNADPTTQVATTGVGSPGQETEYFGALTHAAVIEFQNKYASEVLAPVGLTAGTGYVGSQTRAKLNAMLDDGVVVDPSDPDVPTDELAEILEMLIALSERVEELAERLEKVEDPTLVGDEGDLSVERRNDIRYVELSARQTKDVAMFRVEADDSDVTIERFDVYVDEDMRDFKRDIDNVALYVGGEKVHEMAVSAATVDRDDEYLRFGGLSILVEKDGYVDVVIQVTAADRDEFRENAYNIGPAGSDAIRGRDTAGFNVYADTDDEYREFELTDDPAGELTASDYNSPEEGVVRIEEDERTEVDLLQFEMTAEDADMELEVIDIKLSTDHGTLEEVALDLLLYEVGDDTPVDVQSVTATGSTETIRFDVDMDMDENTSKVFRVVADVYAMEDMEDDGVPQGVWLQADLAFARAYDHTQGEDIELESGDEFDGEKQYLYTVVPELSNISTSVTERDDGVGNVDRFDGTITFDMKALGDDIVFDWQDIRLATTTITGETVTLSNVFVEIDGDEIDNESVTVDENDTVSVVLEGRVHVQGTGTLDESVRLIVDQFQWRLEESGDVVGEYTGIGDILDDLRTRRVTLDKKRN